MAGGFIESGPVEVRLSEGEEVYTAAQVRALLRRVAFKVDTQAQNTESDATAVALYRVSTAIWDALEEE